MRLKTDCLAVVFTIFASVSAFAGGGSCQFKADGLRLMKEQSVLGELLQTKLAIVESGRMGPADSPWDEVIGRMYSVRNDSEINEDIALDLETVSFVRLFSE
jgi:hypothetical protein